MFFFLGRGRGRKLEELEREKLPHLGLEGLGFSLAPSWGHALLLEQGEEFRVREWGAVVGQPVWEGGGGISVLVFGRRE